MCHYPICGCCWTSAGVLSVFGSTLIKQRVHSSLYLETCVWWHSHCKKKIHHASLNSSLMLEKVSDRCCGNKRSVLLKICTAFLRVFHDMHCLPPSLFYRGADFTLGHIRGGSLHHYTLLDMQYVSYLIWGWYEIEGKIRRKRWRRRHEGSPRKLCQPNLIEQIECATPAAFCTEYFLGRRPDGADECKSEHRVCLLST